MEIRLSQKYYRSLNQFVKKNKRNAESTKKALSFFKANSNHPSLHLEKLSGSKLWTVRIDKSNRIFFSWINKTTALFLDIGKHDKYRKY